MIASVDQPKTLERAKPSLPQVKHYTGEVVYIYAFDVAYEMVRRPVRELLGQPVAQFVVDASKRSPRHLFFYRPQMVRLPPLERIGPHGPVRVERVIKLLPVGAISITVRVPFEVRQVEDLVVYHDLQFSNGSLHDEVRRLAEEVRRELHDYFIRPVAHLADEEAYTVFCIESPLTTEDGAGLKAENWLRANRRSVASLLTQEPDIDHLSKQESDESTGRFLSYYEHDIVVIDWDAALLIDEPQNFDETLYVMELANLQLAELEAYDRILDDSLERAYRDLSSRPFRGRTGILRELREIRIDLARLLGRQKVLHLPDQRGEVLVAVVEVVRGPAQEIEVAADLVIEDGDVARGLVGDDDLVLVLLQLPHDAPRRERVPHPAPHVMLLRRAVSHQRSAVS